MFAYSVQNYTPQVLAWNPQTLEPIAILCLALSFFCGLKRIEANYHFLGIGYEKNHALGKATDIEMELKKVEPLKMMMALSQRESLESWKKKMVAQKSRAKSADPILDKLQRRMTWLYHVRTWLMIVGFLLLVFAKVGTPYYSHDQNAIDQGLTKCSSN